MCGLLRLSSFFFIHREPDECSGVVSQQEDPNEKKAIQGKTHKHTVTVGNSFKKVLNFSKGCMKRYQVQKDLVRSPKRYGQQL
jgi:hypothetical protein